MTTVETDVAGHLAASPAGLDGRARKLLLQLFDAAVAAADPAKVLPQHLPPKPAGRCVVVGAGKAAASMAEAVEAAWADVAISGCVVAPYGYGKACTRVRVLEGGHPVPDENSVKAAREILSAVKGLGKDDLVLALISGGGSAAMCLPAEGLTLADKQAANRLLLASGLDIRTMNAARRRLSAIKGGRLAAAAAPARVVTLAISDIPGDNPSAIASGPTAPNEDGALDLSHVVQRLGSALPAPVARLLLDPGPPVVLSNADPVRLVATAASSLEAAAVLARGHGVEPILLGDDLEGEAAELGRAMARQVAATTGPVVLISGGETTVTVGNGPAGQGGRNTEFLLALAGELAGNAHVWALAADTDGEDGANLGAAGAIYTPDTLARARAAGLDARDALQRHDSGAFFDALGDLVRTGPTFTNVNDFRAILVLPTPLGQAIQE
ncbi:glycerate kinase [Novosphingobium sp. TH158]|uniref:glycerate kinase type-2 family protein n=1 Tax=Novosphingobium sp. TH158 TaxID=2067455 RepID=UPI0020B13A96|nr:glycerate kinase [Novosphingobium sp. TH158]